MNEFIRMLSDLDTDILLFFNGLHSPFWDCFMSAFTGKVIWGGMYGYTIAIGLTIAFADQMCNSVIRPLVGRLRPSHPDNPIAELVYIVNGKRGGGFGFPSCHAANSFGLALFLICLFRKRCLSIFILLWAFTNSYTRLYLGLHYPGDLLVGVVIGGLGGWGFCMLAGEIVRRMHTSRKERIKSQQPRQVEWIVYAGLLTVMGIVIYSIM